MPRYFFDLTNGDELADEMGEEFDHAEAVARRTARMPSLEVTSQSSMRGAS